MRKKVPARNVERAGEKMLARQQVVQKMPEPVRVCERIPLYDTPFFFKGSDHVRDGDIVIDYCRRFPITLEVAKPQGNHQRGLVCFCTLVRSEGILERKLK